MDTAFHMTGTRADWCLPPGDATAQVAQLLEAGEDASVPDARGRPPYAVAASKEVRDAFRRHVAAAGEGLAWDAGEAGIPSALTPEMEAAQAARLVRPHPPHSLPCSLACLGKPPFFC